MANAQIYGDNPAGRLYNVFQLARSRGQNHSAAQEWPTVFGPPPSVQRTLRCFAIMADQIIAVRRQVERLEDDDPDVLLVAFHEVESTVDRFINLHVPLASFLEPLKDTGMQGLRVCDSVLHRRLPEPLLASGKVQELVDEVQTLSHHLTEADDLDADTRELISEHLRAIKDALGDVDLAGSAPLSRATDSLIGVLVRKPSVFAHLAESKVLLGVLNLLTAIDLALRVASGLPTLEGSDHDRPASVIVQMYVQTGLSLPAAAPKELPATQRAPTSEPQHAPEQGHGE